MNEELTKEKYKLLYNINFPEDLRKLSVNDLKNLADEIREFLVETVSKTGGHLGSSLGAVELTLALHYVFNTPYDKLVWDVGHQAYVHKILTGRRDVFHTLRQFGGISGFLKITESKYDTFGAGHASTAISSALGMAVARDLDKEKYRVIAIVGDGSMTGGMAFEAMNNAGLQKRNLIVILNDNNMSIAPNVSAITNYFTELISRPEYNKLKAGVWDLTGKLDSLGDRLRKIAVRLEEGIKVVITPGMLFEALGFRYFGPINGHNIQKLIKILNQIKDLNGPILIHVMTEKGKGYPPAEEDAQKLHGISPQFKVSDDAVNKSKTKAPSYTQVAGTTIVELAKQNKKIIGITAAMPDGTGLDQLQREFPERFFDVGIAEQHAVTFAAGLAVQGYIPIAAIYSTFLQRAFDQIIHDVALQKLHVIFAIDRGGIVGADGPTHHGVFDLAYLRIIPNLIVMAPKDENELRHMIYTAVNHTQNPVAIRYPRGQGEGVKMDDTFKNLEIGKAEIIKEGSKIAILAIGKMVSHVLSASAMLKSYGFDPMIVNMRFVKPLDQELIFSIIENNYSIVTVEDGVVFGGFGSAVNELLIQNNLLESKILNLGIPDEFVPHGTPQELYKLLKLDPEGITNQIIEFLEK